MSQTNINNLFNNALASGEIGGASIDALGKIQDLGNIINDALGTPTLGIASSEIILVNLLLDDSDSMSGVRDSVIKAHDELIAAVKETKQVDNIMVQCRQMTGGLIYPFKLINDVKLLTRNEYRTDHMTPLYKSTLEILGITQAKTQECLDNFQDPKSITLVITDGYDNASGGIKPKDVKKLVDDMLNSERHIIAGMGFDSAGNQADDFRQTFKEMGIKDNWILTVASTPSEIRKAFGMFSRSVSSASQSAASFSQTAMGGFSS